MSRTTERREIPPDPRPRYETVEDRRCDVCGIPISTDEPDGDYAHELKVALDEEECVSLLRRRDLCPPCLAPIWKAINALLGVPDDLVDAERDHLWDPEDG
jgi:hypothetical protein